MKANWKSLLFLITVVVVGALFFTFLGGQKQDKQSSGKKDGTEGVVAGSSTIKGDYTEQLAKFLRDKGMVLYGSYQSADSKSQKELFGDDAKYLDYVECDASGPDANPDECILQKVEVYPTWVYAGKAFPGQKSLADLAQIVGFSQ